MSLVIFSEAGYEYGFGHYYRMSGICDKAISNNMPVMMYLIADNVAKSNLKDNYISFLDWRISDNYKSILSQDDTLVVDSYHVELFTLLEFKKIVRNLIVIDDNIRLKYHDMTLLNPNYFAESLNYPKGQNNTYYIGKDYTLLREEFNVHEERAIRNNVKSVLLTMGGTDLCNKTKELIALMHHIDSAIKLHVVATKAYVDLNEIGRALDSNDTLYIDASAADMSKLMWDCDFAISSGGGTSNELIKMQCPSILVVVADNQLLNAKYLSESGVVKIFENDGHDSIASMLQYKERASILEKLKALQSNYSGRDFILDTAFSEVNH